MYDNSSESLYFNSRPHGGRLNQIKIWIFCPVFQLTPSRRATFRSCICYNADRHFNSRPHGGRQFSNIACHMANVFQLTPSRRATYQRQCSCTEPEISTHALTEGDFMPTAAAVLFSISTHALTEGDVVAGVTSYYICISTHALTEGDYSHLLRVQRIQYFNSRPHGGRPLCRLQLQSFFHFNSRPHGGRPRFRFKFNIQNRISTHALTEGDGKFRQIFLLNRGYAYSISLYFLPHFISLLPQILSFQQKSFKFQVRIFLLFSVHLAFALQNQCVHHVKSRFCTNMFYFVFVLFTQIVKPQTIGLFIYDFF